MAEVRRNLAGADGDAYYSAPVVTAPPICPPAPERDRPRRSTSARWSARRPAWIALSLLLAVGCRRKLAPALDAGAPQASSSASAVGAGGSVASTEQTWVLARDGDPLELARLCDALGAPTLGEVIADAGSSPDDRATAIRALAFAEDPTPALDETCRLAATGSVETSTLALQTIVQVAPRRRPIEEIEGGAWRRCGDGLFGLLDKTRDPTRRALAIRALAAIAERGAADPKRIPER
jgi:hypothetical protein